MSRSKPECANPKANILVIEDQTIARRMAKVAFEANECRVDCASTGQEALAKINDKYDLVILDLGLPDIDGLELAKALRSKTSNPKRLSIVALTAHADKQEATKQAGIDDFLIKPLSMRKCDAVMQRYCKK